MERWLSWSKAHDWKSCVPYKGTEGSNPSLSAKKRVFTFVETLFVYESEDQMKFNLPVFRRGVTE